ncbi:hypothetical protein QBL02_00825 [Leucobacter sp. UT-8R-CII-1-4]|uniref:hypothetical protein n=1 Tax=Leucobacter sp. UT-8R-CII-1-4 TaxID=3040075 RepID=UPI0024A92C27|nr:hypothetical protein [Leucobacter sp. UT-8R-CII-1-4]MDI6022081.1 hypothetical protein [Leucobacter sp. UT-8R-CII-1-4]
MSDSPSRHRRSETAWAILAICLAVEAFLLIWVLFSTVLAALNTPEMAAQNYSLVVVVAICVLWVVITLMQSLRSRVSWVRGSAVTIHVLLFAAGTGCLQLLIGPFWLGFGMILLALVGFFSAVIARPILALDSHEIEDEDQPSV